MGFFVELLGLLAVAILLPLAIVLFIWLIKVLLVWLEKQHLYRPRSKWRRRLYRANSRKKQRRSGTGETGSLDSDPLIMVNEAPMVVTIEKETFIRSTDIPPTESTTAWQPGLKGPVPELDAPLEEGTYSFFQIQQSPAISVEQTVTIDNTTIHTTISFPGVVLVGQAEELHVTAKRAIEITTEPAPDLEFPFPDRLSEHEANLTSERATELWSEHIRSLEIEVNIAVCPPDFKLESPPLQSIKIPSDSPSASITFQLVPQGEGKKTVAVEWFKEGHYLGRSELETTASRQKQKSSPISTDVALTLSASQPPPDLTILVDRVPLGQGKHYFRYKLLSPIKALSFSYKEFRSVETHVTPQGFLQETFTHLNQMLADAPSGDVVFFERLNSIGTMLYDRLLPEELKHLYWDELRQRVKNIIIYSDDPWIPWELLRPFQPETKELEDGFLCEKFDLTRWLRGRAAPDRIGLAPFKLIVAAGDLESALLEAIEIEELLGNLVEYVSPSSEAVYNLLKTGGFSALHIICHSEYKQNDPDWSPLFLESGARLYPIDISGDKLIFGHDRPIVFLNACETGQRGYALTGMGGWAEAFVGRAGGSCFFRLYLGSQRRIGSYLRRDLLPSSAQRPDRRRSRQTCPTKHQASGRSDVAQLHGIRPPICTFAPQYKNDGMHGGVTKPGSRRCKHNIAATLQ